jgi:uncharacterized protein YjgD (DUF1641 family)
MAKCGLEEGSMEDQAFVALNAKLDALTQQVAYLTDQAQAAERERQSRAELLHDLTPMMNDGFRIAVEQLEEVQSYTDLSELLRIVKRLLRNASHLESMLNQVESLFDLAQAVGPLTNQAFERATDVLQSAEQKGYFAFARGGAQIVDNVITSFTEEDVRRLGDNVVLILNVVKELTQPAIMQLTRNLVSDVEAEVSQEPLNTGLPALLRQMGDPAVRRGLALTLRMLRAVGRQGTAPRQAVVAPASTG